MDGCIGKQKTDNKIDKYLWVLIGQKQQPFSLNPHVTPIYITFIVRECDFMVGDNKWNIKTSKQARQGWQGKAGKQEWKLARKHFYFMAFDNIGGTYLFPCHASSNQMRIQSNWIEVFGIVGALELVAVAFLLSMFQFKSIHFQFVSNIHIKSLYLFRYSLHTNFHPVVNSMLQARRTCITAWISNKYYTWINRVPLLLRSRLSATMIWWGIIMIVFLLLLKNSHFNFTQIFSSQILRQIKSWQRKKNWSYLNFNKGLLNDTRVMLWVSGWSCPSDNQPS